MVPGVKVAGGIKRVFDNPQSMPKSGLCLRVSFELPKSSAGQERRGCLNRGDADAA